MSEYNGTLAFVLFLVGFFGTLVILSDAELKEVKKDNEK